MAILSDILDPIFGSDTKEQDRAAQDYLKQATDAYSGIKLPQTEIPNPESQVDLGGYAPSTVSAQNIPNPEMLSYDLGDPRLAGVVQQGDSAYNDISIDPRLRSNQNDALAALAEISQGGGFNAQDRANLSRIHSEESQADRGRREAILQNLGARGMSGGGMDLLAQLQSSQAATDRESQRGLDVAGQGQQRALDAIMQSGQLSGQMQGQDFSQEAQKAAAQNAINQFNAQNTNVNNLANANIANQFTMNQAAGRLGAQQNNVANTMAAQTSNANRGMQAQQFNAGAANAASADKTQNAQNTANANVQARNQAAAATSALPQQNFQNQISVANGKSGAAQAGVGYYDTQAGREIAKDSNYLDALIKGGSAYAASGSSKK